MINSHKITIIFRLKNFLYVLILPIISGLIEFIRFGRIRLTFTLFSIILLLLIPIIILEWKNLSLHFKGNKILYSHGFFLRKKSMIELNDLSSFSISNTPLLSLLHAVRVDFITGSYKGKKSDVSFTLKKDDIKSISSLASDESERVIYKSKVYQVILSSFSSSFFAKLIVVIPLLKEASSVISEKYQKTIISTLESYSEKFLYFAPTILGTIALAIFLIWFLTGIFSFIRLFGFSLYENKDFFIVTHGVLWKQKKYIKKSNISALSIVETPVFSLLGLSFVQFSSFSRKLDDISGGMLLLPMRRKQTDWYVKKITGKDFSFTPKTQSEKGIFIANLYLPVILFILQILFAFISLYIFPSIKKAIILVSIIISTYLFSSFLLLFKRARISGFTADDDFFLTFGRSFLSYKEGVIYKGKISFIKIKQSLPQILSRKGSLFIFPRSNHNDKFSVFSIKKSTAKEAIDYFYCSKIKYFREF